MLTRDSPLYQPHVQLYQIVNMSSIDDTAQRAQLRPYYDPETFNIGYPAVFHPDKGVLDQEGVPIAAKLSIANQSRSIFGAGGRLARGQQLIGKLVRSKSSNSFGVNGSGSSGGGSGIGNLYGSSFQFGLNDLFSLSKWEGLVWKVLFRQYMRNLIQQPFETCKIIMQTSSVGAVQSEIQRQEGQLQAGGEIKNGSSSTRVIATGAEAGVVVGDDEEEEIDFFPMYGIDSTDRQAYETYRLSQSQSKAAAEATAVRLQNANSSVLVVEKLDTLSIISAMRENKSFGIRSLWRSNNVTFLYNFLSQGIQYLTSRIVSPFYFYYNLKFPQVLGLKIFTNFVSELLLLPLDLYKLKSIISKKNDKEEREKEENTGSDAAIKQEGPDGVVGSTVGIGSNRLRVLNFWKYNIDNKVLRLYGLIFLKISFRKLFEHGLDFFVYYWLNFTNVENRLFFILALRFLTEVCEFFFRLPIETLLRRYQVDYLVNGNAVENSVNPGLKVDPQDLIIRPVNVNTAERWKGLWNGWKIGLMSLLCGFTFKLMNKIDDDLEQEGF